MSCKSSVSVVPIVSDRGVLHVIVLPALVPPKNSCSMRVRPRGCVCALYAGAAARVCVCALCGCGRAGVCARALCGCGRAGVCVCALCGCGRAGVCVCS